MELLASLHLEQDGQHVHHCQVDVIDGTELQACVSDARCIHTHMHARAQMEQACFVSLGNF